MESHSLYSIYLYDDDDGALTKVIPHVQRARALHLATELHHQQGLVVKVVDEFDGAVVYTLGV